MILAAAGSGRRCSLRVVTLLGLFFAAAIAQAADAVPFAGRDITLSAILYRPAGAGPFPAVVALHGCAGLYGRDGELAPRHVDWAERLAADGFVVLFPDSFGSRGAQSQCRTGDRGTGPSRERGDDAFTAKAYLQSRHDVAGNLISLLGWSNGGSTVLYAVQKGRKAKDSKPDFAKAIAFYPGCRTPIERSEWHARIPLMILIGAL